MSKACLVDTTRCIGCRACQVACKAWNELVAEETVFSGTGGSYENPPALSAKTYTRITFHEIVNAGGVLERSVFVKRQCMHCIKPSCVSACPVAALKKVDQTGAVVYDRSRCMGCRYCMMACPFNVPTLEWDKAVAYIKKCTFCTDRLEEPPARNKVNGKPLAEESLERFQNGQRTPACAKVCPTGAIQFGNRDQLIAEAHRRIAKQNVPRNSWRYVDHVYCLNEVGGTAWLYLSAVPFEKLGFRTDLGDRPYPEYTSLALDAVPVVVLGIGAAAGGAYWFSQRRSRLAKAAQIEDAEDADSKGTTAHDP